MGVLLAGVSVTVSSEMADGMLEVIEWTGGWLGAWRGLVGGGLHEISQTQNKKETERN